MDKLKLFGEHGWGSAIVESQLVWYGVPYELHRVGDLFEDADARAMLEAYNPLAQIPTVVLEDGSIMTESAAITLWLADRTGLTDLVPEPAAPERGRFLRWLVFITSNVYPTYTYADDPSRFVKLDAAQQGFADAVNEYRKKLYGLLEGEASGPYFLGERISAIDFYVCTMTRWRPGRSWFEASTPTLVDIAARVATLPRVTEVWARNFPDE